LAEAIRRISLAVEVMIGSGLNRRAMVVLLSDSSKVRRRDIESVLDSLEELAETYCDA